MTLALSTVNLSEADVNVELKQLERWAEDFEALMVRLQPRFKRRELRDHVKDYLQGLLSSAERKNSWQLAEQVGDPTP